MVPVYRLKSLLQLTVSDVSLDFFFLSRTPYCGGCMVWHRMLFYELFYSLLLVGRAVANSLSAGEKNNHVERQKGS